MGKRLSALIMLFVLAAGILVGCGKQPPPNKEITLPASFVQAYGMEALEFEDLVGQGVISTTTHDDGSITFVLDGAMHAQMMDELRGEIMDGFEELRTDGILGYIQAIEVDEDLSVFTVTVDREGYTNNYGGAILGVYPAMGGCIYQLFNTVPVEQLSVVVQVVDGATGETFETMQYPQT
ncbi:hypothetical protein LJB77_02375 [Ruminococcaceae bacterium OttesenSCG-928-N02]|nr:hypothetical protein [Ruminococcaceae bacterium OttesenSCG-928-N02]